MKTTRLLFLISFIFLLGTQCTPEPVIEDVIQIEHIQEEIPDEDLFAYDSLQGNYTGKFGNSTIRIILNLVSSKHAIGYNIHKGLQRNLAGSVTTDEDGTILLTLSEPGDHEYDGVFNIKFNQYDPEPSGSWTSNSGEIPAKEFTLEKSKEVTLEDFEYESFSSTFYGAYDTLSQGEYYFEDDGFVQYIYYPNQDDVHRIEQSVEFSGSWELNGRTLIIEWEKNPVFPSQKMIYNLTQEEYQLELTHPTHSIFQQFYP